MGFLVVILFYCEKVKSRASDQFCPVIPGYRKASKTINPGRKLLAKYIKSLELTPYFFSNIKIMGRIAMFKDILCIYIIYILNTFET